MATGASRSKSCTGRAGVGKTVLLDRYAAIAIERKWAVVRHEARSPGDPIGAIVEQLHACAGLTKKLSRELVELRERWGEESQTLNLGVYRRESKRERRDAIPIAQQFASAVLAVGEHCTKDRRGLMILVDEVQEVHPDELSVFGPIMQDLSRRPELTAMIVFGGLPDTPGLVTDAVTYGERMAFHPIDNLDNDATLQALAGPADSAGRPFDGDALAVLADATGGYPYFVQLFGDYAWQTSDGHTRITLDDANQGDRPRSARQRTRPVRRPVEEAARRRTDLPHRHGAPLDQRSGTNRPDRRRARQTHHRAQRRPQPAPRPRHHRRTINRTRRSIHPRLPRLRAHRHRTIEADRTRRRRRRNEPALPPPESHGAPGRTT